jgi:hypothetical protein
MARQGETACVQRWSSRLGCARVFVTCRQGHFALCPAEQELFGLGGPITDDFLLRRRIADPKEVAPVIV